MRPRRPHLVLAAVAALLVARPSLAAGPDASVPPPPPAPAPAERVAAAPFVQPVDTRGFAETLTGAGAYGLGVGVGGRIGTTFSNGVSLAGSAMYQGWESGRLASLGSALYAGGEAGYDLNLRHVLVLRPYFAVGVAIHAAGQTADAELAVWGGLQASYDIPRTRLFVAVDVRVVSTATEEDLTVAGFAGFGVKFGS